MKDLFRLLSILYIAAVSIACKPGNVPENIDVRFAIPENVEIPSGTETFDFRVQFSKPPLQTDIIIFVDESGVMYDCPITKVSNSSFTVRLFDGIASGKYDIYLKRGTSRKHFGEMTVTVTQGGNTDIEITPPENASVYGIVVGPDGKGIPDVVVSDGVEVVITDKDGIYGIASAKKNGYVFISIPSGYEVASAGVLPQFHKPISKSQATPERIDFSLIESGDQTNHTMLVFGDLHLAGGKNHDRTHFKKFTSEINEYLAANSGRKVYGLTLGDMTWEMYWISRDYNLTDYVMDANAIKGLQIFHTIGNHDHEMESAGDFETVKPFRKIISPNYYSFNIGDIHYVVLDNIKCKNTGSSDPDSRDEELTIIQEELDWLEKDIAYIPDGTPVVVAMHAPLYRFLGTMSFIGLSGGAEMLDILKGHEVQVITGHTHRMNNVDNLSEKKVFEHNAGAVCATWWWTQELKYSLGICTDGAPAGYKIMDISGSSFEWLYKAIGRPESYQFNSYDRNCISMTADKYCPSADDNAKDYFEKCAKDYVSVNTENIIYLNIWDWDPAWKIEVTEEGGKVLEYTQVSMKDPLHLAAYTGARLEKDKTLDGKLKFETEATQHFFRLQASSPDTDLDIKVTDGDGNVYTEKMVRPKEFDPYKY